MAQLVILRPESDEGTVISNCFKLKTSNQIIIAAEEQTENYEGIWAPSGLWRTQQRDLDSE